MPINHSVKIYGPPNSSVLFNHYDTIILFATKCWIPDHPIFLSQGWFALGIECPIHNNYQLEMRLFFRIQRALLDVFSGLEFSEYKFIQSWMTAVLGLEINLFNYCGHKNWSLSKAWSNSNTFFLHTLSLDISGRQTCHRASSGTETLKGKYRQTCEFHW